MSASYIFSSEGLVDLTRYVAPDTLFAFDLDGTLAPIVEEYTAAKVSEPVRTTLERLVKLARVAVITGRSRKDALSILGVVPHLIVGNHGAEWPDDSSSGNRSFAACCTAWRDQLNREIYDIRGVVIEFKGESISVHYRKAPDQQFALKLINQAIDKLTPTPKVIGGKYVVNLLPMESFTKGEALVAALERFGLRRAIYFGDDVTDEEVFKLRGVDLFGIRIGNDAQTEAAYFLKNQTELLGLLNAMVGIMEVHAGAENA